jgi:hypothetical protein
MYLSTKNFDKVNFYILSPISSASEKTDSDEYSQLFNHFHTNSEKIILLFY